MQYDIPYEQALADHPAEVRAVVAKLRRGRSMHKEAPGAELTWAYTIEDDGIHLSARKGRWRGQVILPQVPPMFQADEEDLGESDTLESLMAAVPGLSDLLIAVNHRGGAAIIIHIPPEGLHQDDEEDELLELEEADLEGIDSDDLFRQMNARVGSGDIEGADRLASLLVQVLQRGGSRPTILRAPVALGKFRTACRARGVGDPTPGLCPKCHGEGCGFCGHNGFLQ